MAEEGDLLTVYPQRKIKLPEKVIDVRGLSPTVIWRYVSSVYRSGCDEFKIIFDSGPEKKRYSAFSYNTVNLLHTQEGSKEIVLSPIEVVQAMINRCIGVEIIDQRENWCIVKELGETTYKEFDNALRRVFLLLISMAEEINKAIKPRADKESLKSAHIIDTNIDRFTDFCFRVLSKKGYQEYRKTPTMHSILFMLEMIGDEFKKIAIHLLEAKSISPKMESLFKIQSDQLRKYYTLFYGFNRERCSEIYEHDQNGHHYNLSLYESLNTAEKEILHHLKKIGIYLLSLTELRIDLEY